MTMTMRADHPDCIHALELKHFLYSMTTLPHASHAFRKKGYALHYTPPSLVQFQPEIHQSALELVNV